MSLWHSCESISKQSRAPTSSKVLLQQFPSWGPHQRSPTIAAAICLSWRSSTTNGVRDNPTVPTPHQSPELPQMNHLNLNPSSTKTTPSQHPCHVHVHWCMSGVCYGCKGEQFGRILTPCLVWTKRFVSAPTKQEITSLWSIPHSIPETV